MARNHANLELPVDDTAFDGVDGRHMQIERHVGCAIAEQRNRPADVGGRIAGGLVKHRHMQLPAQTPVDFIDADPECLGRGQQTQRFGVYLLALGGQRKAATSAPAQGQAEPHLEIFDVPTDGGGTDIEFELGRRHAAAVDHGLEHAQQP